MMSVTAQSRQPQIVVRFFGDFEVTLNGSPVTKWGAGKSRSLFQVLARRRGTSVTDSRLYDLLWPGVEGIGERSSLKVAVHGLRRVLAPVASDGGSQIVRTSHGYAFTPRSYASDADRFEQLIRDGVADLAADNEDAGHRRLRQAMELYTGDLLEGEDAEWIVTEREHYRGLALRGLSLLRSAAERNGDIEELDSLCRRILWMSPHHEATYRALMRAHAARTDWDAVARWYSLCEHRLATELGVGPQHETTRLRSALLDKRPLSSQHLPRSAVLARPTGRPPFAQAVEAVA